MKILNVDIHSLSRFFRVSMQRAGADGMYILIALLVLIFALWGFAELADEVMDGETQRIDEAILHAFRKDGDLATPIGPPWLLQAMRDVTALGGHTVLTLVTFIVAGFCALMRRFGVILMILVASSGGMALSALMKELFARARPDTMLHLAEVSTASFPSGHSMLSAAIYLSIAVIVTEITPSHRARIYIILIALMLTGLVGISRIFLGVHYPSDVLAGWGAGIAWAIFCWFVMLYITKRRMFINPGAV